MSRREMGKRKRKKRSKRKSKAWSAKSCVEGQNEREHAMPTYSRSNHVVKKRDIDR